MIRYLVRRILLFLPTIIGATFVIFMLMALSPTSIVDALLPPGGNMLPGQRAAREAYIEERYGLTKPPVLRYLRWLNNVSPVGFSTWRRDDAEVEAAKADEVAKRKLEETRLIAAGMAQPEAEKKARKAIDTTPNAGDVRSFVPKIKSSDFGESWKQGRKVWPIIMEALPVTMTLQAISLPIAIAIALLTGIRAARYRGKTSDKAISVTLLGLYSIPVIWLGVMLIGYLANVKYVKAFPATGLHSNRADEMSFLPTFAGGFERGYLLDSTWHLILPIICISYATVAFYSKLTRTSLLETLGSDFVRTARAKGLPESTVLYRHAFRNSLIPLITVAAGFLPRLVTGSIVVEYLFNIDGMGKLAIEALKLNDAELFLGVSLFILILQLIGNLLADILYVIADPRVSYDQ